MRRALIFWAVCSAIGAAIIALPDDGPRLISFSEAHGPSALDAFGICFLLVGWAAFLAAIWRRRGRVAARAPLRWVGGCAFALGLGTGLVIASAASDYAHWWAIGAGVLVAVQVLGAYAVLRF